MKLTDKKIDELNYQLTLDLTKEDYAEPQRKRITATRKNADFKGFRKGNVPESLIRKVYGEQILFESVNEVISKSLDEYIKSNKLNVLGEPLPAENQPQLEWKDGNDFTFVFDLAVSPEVSVDVVKEDTVTKYNITIDEKDKTQMVENLKKYYDEKKEEKSEEDIVKEVTERLEGQLKQEADWRFNRDIRDFFVKKADVKLPEDFLKRWLVSANEGKVSKEDVEKDFPAFAQDFKWQLVRGSLMKKYELKITDADMDEAAKAYVAYQYAMYGIGNVPEEMIAEAAKNVLADRKQFSTIEEQVEDTKVLAKIAETITVKTKKITSEKFRELK
ncbi:MAG: trigger factor family protein [Bacteroidales bacterium]|nr:trigger factor family protein [Bacteroidales bacterium]